MPLENGIFPAVARAADAIDRKRMNDASRHSCAGAHCAICSWRTSDIAEISRTIERELHLFAIVLLLRKLESLRTEVDTAMQSETGHLLALGGKNRLEGITVRMSLFTEARLLLGTIRGQQCNASKTSTASSIHSCCGPWCFPAKLIAAVRNVVTAQL